MRRATCKISILAAISLISIHALREESDFLWHWYFYNNLSISIHALREESDPSRTNETYMLISHFNPRSPWGERLGQCGIDFISISISIHALGVVSDVTGLLATILQTLFQSTLSVRRATITACTEVAIIINFNPRSPWGERQYSFPGYQGDEKGFQSTLSVRRATILLL